MAGEMNKTDMTKEAFPIHFAVARSTGGEVKPFDMYQGPYVYIPGQGKLWLYIDNMRGYWYNEFNERESGYFNPYANNREACKQARSILTGVLHGFDHYADSQREG